MKKISSYIRSISFLFIMLLPVSILSAQEDHGHSHDEERPHRWIHVHRTDHAPGGRRQGPLRQEVIIDTRIGKASRSRGAFRMK